MRLGSVRNLLLLTLLLSFTAAEADAVDITGFVGGVKPGQLSFKGVTSSLDSGPVYGLRLGWGFLPFLDHEHTLAFSSDYLFPTSLKSVTDSNGFVYNSNLVLHVKVKRAEPYLTAGLGLIHQYGSEIMTVGTKFAINYGGGVKFPGIAGPLGLRIDVRGYTATGFSSGSLNMIEVSGGVLFRLGK